MNSMIGKLKESARKRSAYWRTVREIRNMPADEANDLGISVHDAHRIAHEAIYG